MGNTTELAPFSPIYAGLGVCAHDDAAETTAVFSDVTVEPPPADPRFSGKRAKPVCPRTRLGERGP